MAQQARQVAVGLPGLPMPHSAVLHAQHPALMASISSVRRRLGTGSVGTCEWPSEFHAFAQPPHQIQSPTHGVCGTGTQALATFTAEACYALHGMLIGCSKQPLTGIGADVQCAPGCMPLRHLLTVCRLCVCRLGDGRLVALKSVDLHNPAGGMLDLEPEAEMLKGACCESAS